MDGLDVLVVAPSLTASETSAFGKIRAHNRRCAGLVLSGSASPAVGVQRRSTAQHISLREFPSQP